MVSSSFLQYLATLACLALATQAAIPQSYRSFKTVLANLRSAPKIDQKCIPACTDSNGDPIEGTHIRDPTSCNQYWICMPNGELFEYPHECPDGEIVNVNDDVVNCEPIIDNGASQCTIDPDCDPSIPKVCYTQDTCPPLEDGIQTWADPADCNKYHVCHYPATLSCEDDKPYFNGQECTNDKIQCCACQTVCREAWTFIPDPSDSTCNSYFLCQDLQGVGYPYIATAEEKFNCLEGEVIDTTTGLCSDSAACTPNENCI